MMSDFSDIDPNVDPTALARLLAANKAQAAFSGGPYGSARWAFLAPLGGSHHGCLNGHAIVQWLDLAPLQSRVDSEVISPTAMAGGNTGLVLCQVGGQYSGQ